MIFDIGAFMNRHTLIGKMAADPELRRFPSGDPVVNFRMATSEYWRDNNSGELKERTEWHNVVAKGRNAETLANWARQGSTLLVEGTSRSRKWSDDNGKDHHVTEVHIDWWRGMHHAQTTGRAQGKPATHQQDDGGDRSTDVGQRPDYRTGPF